MELYLSQYLCIEPGVLDTYGAFDVSVASDLPLFIDPFLLFHSDKPEYQALHEGILKYLRFLRDPQPRAVAHRRAGRARDAGVRVVVEQPAPPRRTRPSHPGRGRAGVLR